MNVTALVFLRWQLVMGLRHHCDVDTFSRDVGGSWGVQPPGQAWS